jgi:hypothetical protein
MQSVRTNREPRRIDVRHVLSILAVLAFAALALGSAAGR